MQERQLAPYTHEIFDPEASYRRGYQHGATEMLRLVAAKLAPDDARALTAWAGAALRDWRILGHEAADSPHPPLPPDISN